ncbi:hypothetical protein EDB19DRAFT_1695930 [Suillus lakei]|nr:hypothetical protein EDB19DRAFT_1695930 [Suillus lakei]
MWFRQSTFGMLITCAAPVSVFTVSPVTIRSLYILHLVVTSSVFIVYSYLTSGTSILLPYHRYTTAPHIDVLPQLFQCFNICVNQQYTEFHRFA